MEATKTQDFVECPACGKRASNWLTKYADTTALSQALESHAYNNCTANFIAAGEDDYKTQKLKAEMRQENAREFVKFHTKVVTAAMWDPPGLNVMSDASQACWASSSAAASVGTAYAHTAAPPPPPPTEWPLPSTQTVPKRSKKVEGPFPWAATVSPQREQQSDDTATDAMISELQFVTDKIFLLKLMKAALHRLEELDHAEESATASWSLLCDGDKMQKEDDGDKMQ